MTADERDHLVKEKRFGILFLVLGFLVTMGAAYLWAVDVAHAHDVYKNLYSGGSPGVGQWCCSGDAVTGDCEAVYDNYRIEPNGDAIFYSERYKVNVRVARDKITWLAVVGGENSAAHWCGKLRAKFPTPNNEVSVEQIDPVTWTYCAFIAPGGV